MFSNKVQIYEIYDKGNNLIGGFHLYKQKKFGLTIYRNPPFTPTIGPFLQIKAKNPVVIMNKWKEILSLMADFFEKLPYAYVIEYNDEFVIYKIFDLNLNKDEKIIKVTFRDKESNDEDHN